MQFGVFSATDVIANPITGVMPECHERISAIRTLARHAESAGFDVFSIAEHHRTPYFSSSPTTLMSAIAADTETILLNTATTLLTTNDPVQLAEKHATLDQLSKGRNELMLWRGHTAPYHPWKRETLEFGLDFMIEHYHLLHRLWHEEVVNWEGRYRPSLIEYTSTPRPYHGVPPYVWHSAHYPEIADHAAYFGDGFVINMNTPIETTTKLLQHFRERYEMYGHGHANQAIVSVLGYVFTAKNSQDAFNGFGPYYDSFRHRIAGPKLIEAANHTGLAIGSTQQVIEKILSTRDLLDDYQRHTFIIDHSGIPLHVVQDQIDILATQVVPVLKREFESRRLPGIPSDPPSHSDRLHLYDLPV